MKLYLTRHTETTYNVLGKINCDPKINVELTDKGRQQAASLAEQLKDVDFDAIYVSQLIRTRQTAEIINQYHGVDIITDARLDENVSGFDDYPTDAWITAMNTEGNDWNATFNGGESLNDVLNRLIDFVDDLQSKQLGAVLVVTHGTPVQLIRGYLMHTLDKTKMLDFDFPQGSFVEFEV